MRDAKGHGSDPRGGTAGRQPAARQQAHSFKKTRRQLGSGGGGGGGGGSGGGSGVGGGGSMQNKHKSGAHTVGIHNAVGKNLAQLSAAGTTPNIPAPIIGGRK